MASKHWKFRTICCIPNYIITMLLIISIAGVTTLLLETDAAHLNSKVNSNTMVYRSIFFTMIVLAAVVVSLNLYTVLRIAKTLLSSHHRRIAGSYLKIGSRKEDSCISSLKKEIDTIVQMVCCFISFAIFSSSL